MLKLMINHILKEDQNLLIHLNKYKSNVKNKNKKNKRIFGNNLKD